MRATLRQALSRAGGLSAVAAFLVGSAATQTVDEPDRPTVHLDADVRGADGPRCRPARELARERGAAPAGTREVAELTLRADRTVDLSLLEDVAATWAAERCADGVSVRRAVAAEGAEGVTEAVVVVWAEEGARAPPPDVPEAPAPAPDRGHEDSPWLEGPPGR